MNKATITTIDNVLRSDPEATPEQRSNVLKACRATKAKRRLGTSREAAEILGTHVETIRRYARQGRLKPIRISQRLHRFDLDQVEQLGL